VPRYLEEIDPSQTAEETIHRLCFSSTGILFREFDQIFSDLFSRRSEAYRRLVTTLVSGSKDVEGICRELGIQRSAQVDSDLHNLDEAGFISRDYTWKIGEKRQTLLSQYRLSDNYLRFYLKWIGPNKEKISSGLFEEMSLYHFPGWNTIMGLQFENLVVNNRRTLIKLLQIEPAHIVQASPFFQRATKRWQGCQVDLLIETLFHCLYVCEIKFSRNPLDLSIVDEVKEKIERINTPRNYSFSPVLIHVGGVSDAVIQSGFFAKIIDFNDLLGGQAG